MKHSLNIIIRHKDAIQDNEQALSRTLDKFRALYYYDNYWLVETDYDFYDYVRSGSARSALKKFAGALGAAEMWVYNADKVAFEGGFDDWLAAHKAVTGVFGEKEDDYEWDGTTLGDILDANEEFLNRYDIYYDPFMESDSGIRARRESEAAKREEYARIVKRESGAGLLDVGADDVGTITLRSGIVIPRFGYRVGRDTSWGAVASALDMGFRMVRTGGDCMAEAAACRGIKESGMARREVFVVSSVRNVDSRDAAARQIDKLLESLGSSYIDLLIMETSSYQTDVYRAMEDAMTEGKLRALGVSGYAPMVGCNLPRCSLQNLEEEVKTVPDVSEFEANFLTILPEVDRLRKCGIAVFAEYPLGRWSDVENFEQISAIASTHGVTNAQVALRYIYQLGILFAVEAKDEREMRRLISVAAFSLSDDEMKTIGGMNLRQSYSDTMYIR